MALTLALQHLLRDIFLPFQLIQSAADLDYQRNTLQGPLKVAVYYNTLHAYPAKVLHNSGDVVAALSTYKLSSSFKDLQKHVGHSFAEPNCSTTNSAIMKLDKPAENVMFIVYKKLNTIMPGHYIQSKVILPQLNVLCPDFETTASRYDLLSSRYLEYLSRDESFEILRQFERLPLKPGRQVMWSGVPREWVQIWADEHDMQTLTTAMGPLMDKNNPLCKRNNKSPRAWSRYIMGASGLFAEHLPKGQVVTVLLRPPPYRLDPRGLSTYQMLEQPVLKGELGGMAVIRIDVVHITVRGAEDSAYQFWPVDEGYQWTQKHDASHLSTSSGRRKKTHTTAAFSSTALPILQKQEQPPKSSVGSTEKATKETKLQSEMDNKSAKSKKMLAGDKKKAAKSKKILARDKKKAAMAEKEVAKV